MLARLTLGRLVTVSVCLVLGALAQTQLPPPEGGGGGSDWQIGFVKGPGETRFEIYRYDQYNQVEHLQYVADWQTNVVTEDGIPIQYTGLKASSNGTQDSRTLEASDEGEVTITVQYVGQGLAPEHCPLRISNVAMAQGASQSGTLSADVDNGMDSVESIRTHGSSTTVDTPGEKLRIVELDEEGYGELTLDVSSEASISGTFGTNCKASAAQIAAYRDERRASITHRMGVSQFYEKGTAFSDFIEIIIYQGESYEMTETWQATNISIKPIEIQYGGRFTDYARWYVGLTPDKHIGPLYDPPSQSGQFESYSFNPYFEQMNGHGAFDLRELGGSEDDLYSPSTGTFPAQASAYATLGTRQHCPVNRFLITLGNYERFEEHLTFCVGETRRAQLTVTYPDGVEAESIRDVVILNKIENATKLASKDCYDEDFRRYALTPVDSNSPMGGDWVSGAHPEADFTTFPEYVFLKGSMATVKVGGNAAIGLFEPGGPWGAMIAAAIEGYELIVTDTLESSEFEVERDGSFIAIELESGSSGSVSEFNNLQYRGLYEWRVEVVPWVKLTPSVSEKWGASGFEGMDVTYEELWTEYARSPKVLKVFRMED